ncbi:hypothetical protein GGR56DRAFT_277321 [Xylariaceae sp. FL0804]|nr:hypothetical protein GGR56DRAFT_277321 [Xylariaceae sp. FL0804]
MRAQILTLALALTPLASAWPKWLPDIDSLVVRDDSATTDGATATATQTTSSAEETATTTAKDDATTATDDATTTTDGNEPKTTNLNTGGQTTTTGTQTGTDSDSKTSSTKSISINPEDGAGGVSMITPSSTATTTLYRISDPDPITWVWNYTSLQASPTAIDVMISCSLASATWTLTQNMSFAPTATFTWDSNAFQQSAVASPLVVEMYTLLVVDSDSSVSATASAGYLAAYDQFSFGLYTNRPYQSDVSEFQCVTCSAANGDLDRKALGFAVTMSVITVLSFTWYVTGFANFL